MRFSGFFGFGCGLLVRLRLADGRCYGVTVWDIARKGYRGSGADGAKKP